MQTPAVQSLRNHFLIAMPQLQDQNFNGTIAYICEHNDEGAMAIVINRPAPVRLGDMLEQLELDRGPREDCIYLGGPLQKDRGFVLHDGDDDWQSTLSVAGGLSVTTSRDILAAVASGQGPANLLVALGYAGWDEGQLEQEIADNVWLTCEADPAILFQVSAEQRVQAALGRIGVDYSRLSCVAGHA